MGWFNYYGLAIIAIIMAPNVVYAVLKKAEKYKSQLINVKF